jgi:NitT/TauT family transport system ATP-binding protein
VEIASAGQLGEARLPARGGLTNLLRLSALEYHYQNGLAALGGIDLDIGEGEVVAVVGRSGCGKSTLLSLIAGLLFPTAGSVVWDEAVFSRHHREKSRRLALVFQRDTVLPWRSVERNIQFGMECISLKGRERQEWTETLLTMGGLESFRDAYPRALSGGMRRRVALLMGLAVRPAVLLLDEPFAAVDEPTRVQLSADVLSLAYKYGVSVVLVTHDIGEAISIADRVVVLTNRPAKVRCIFPVEFGHNRDIFSVRETTEFARLYREVWHELWTVIREDRPEAQPELKESS